MIYIVGGARPNFMKIAAITRSFDKINLPYEIIHTGQHYDYNMNQVFFDEFKLKKPLHHLEVGSGPHGQQTGLIMDRFERICINDKPKLILTVGDVNSTMAAALVGSKLHIPVAHQEAGMRSGDKKMPEEINRIVADHVSDILFPISKQDEDNLLNEGIEFYKIFCVGDPMIDNLLYYTDDIKEAVEPYVMVEIHRPANVDKKENLENILKGLSEISNKYKVIFTIHPRTKKMINEFELNNYLNNIDVREPMGYFEFIKHMKNSKCMITDSDGIQQETSILNIPCIALRDTSNIEYTINYGTTELCDCNSEKIMKLVEKAMNGKYKQMKYPSRLMQLNDGTASDKIASVIQRFMREV